MTLLPSSFSKSSQVFLAILLPRLAISLLYVNPCGLYIFSYSLVAVANKVSKSDILSL